MTDVAKMLQDLRGATEAENTDMAQQGGGSKFTVQPMPRPGVGCLARFMLHHNYANGLNISGTEVALVFGGQVVAKHPRFDYEPRRRAPALQETTTTGAIFLPKLSARMLIGSRGAAADESFADRIWRACGVLGSVCACCASVDWSARLSGFLRLRLEMT